MGKGRESVARDEDWKAGRLGVSHLKALLLPDAEPGGRF